MTEPTTPHEAVSSTEPPRHLGKLLGFRFIRADETEAIIEAEPTPDHQNSGGMIHGGFLAALLDTTTGWAIQMHLPPGKGAPHVSLSIQYARAGVLGAPLRCRATVVGAGRRISSTEAVITQNGRVLARALGTHAVVDGFHRARGE